jgi:predicted phosphate transport protein (TIGR00153 family)
LSGEYFGHVIKDKKIQKVAEELFFQLLDAVNVAYGKYVEAIKAWRSQDYDTGYSLREEIIQLEKEADKVKDVFFEDIFRKKAYLPQIREERHLMMLNADKLLGRIERAVRILCLKKIDATYFPEEFDLILEKTAGAIKLFIEANKAFFNDYDEAARLSRNVEDVRDEVRDLYYTVLEKAVNDQLPRGTTRLLNASTRIVIEAEEGIDFLKVLIAKHS